MGCDIHLYVEKRENEKWVAVRNTNPYIADYERYAKTDLEKGDFEGSKKMQERVDKMRETESVVLEGWLYNGRNYNLFAILAGVRNKYDIIPIKEPRGLPEDLSPNVLRESEYAEGDGHSYSYYTFKELKEYDWDNNSVENEAYVGEETYKKFKITGCPYPCCGGAYGGNTEIVLNSEMERIIKRKYRWEEDRHFYTAIKWKEKHSEIGSKLLENINKYISENSIENLNDHRIVFWFDN